MNIAIESAVYATVVKETLTDGSCVFDVNLTTLDGDKTIFNCLSESHAETLCAQINDCSSVETIPS